MANRLFGKIGINYKIKRINLVFDGNGDKKEIGRASCRERV